MEGRRGRVRQVRPSAKLIREYPRSYKQHPLIMNVNDLPEDVVRHEIMEYLKPVYKVVEIEFIKVVTRLEMENNMPLETNTSTKKKLFKVMSNELTIPSSSLQLFCGL